MKFAVVSAWPEIKNAEYECVERIKISAANIGAECIVVDNEGFIIGENDKRTGEILSGNEVEFVIALHFVTEKLYNCYMYGAMWNPPKFLLDWDYNTEAIKYFTYDDYLVYGSKKIVGHLDNLLTQTDKDLTNALVLVPSIPGNILEPNLDGELKLFYSGINWERISNSKGRHHDLFKSLDDQGLTKIYGPEKFFDAVPWEGFKTYAGSLPFDGLSAIRAINECGASLVLSSDTHREAEAATNRLYESCAAGAIIIADDNPFVKREFGNSVLYIKYDTLDCQKNVNQIRQHLEWIKNNRLEAFRLAKQSQQIYQEKFYLDKVLGNVLANHQARKREVISLTCDVQTKVSVIVRCFAGYDYKIDNTLNSLNQQYNRNNIELILICDEKDYDEFKARCAKILAPNIEQKIVALSIFQENKRIISTGKMLIEALKYATADCIAILDPGRIFYEDHLALLVKQLKSKSKSLIYSGFAIENVSNEGIGRNKGFFGVHHINYIASFSSYVELSSVVFSKNILSQYLKCLQFMDGQESYLITLAAYLNKGIEFSYKTTLSICKQDGEDSVLSFNQIIDDSWQIRLINDAFIFNQKLNDSTMGNVRYIQPENIDADQIEVLLKAFVRNKLSNKFPRLFLILKKIYNKFFK